MNSQDSRLLDKLIAEVRALPDRHNRAATVARLRQITETVTNTMHSVAQASVGRKCLDAVGWTRQGSSGTNERAKAIAAAQDLIAFIKGGKIGPSSKKDDSLMVTIVESANRIHREIDGAWGIYFTGRIQGYRKLSVAARDAKLHGADALSKGVECLADRTKSLPTDDSAIAEVSLAVSGVLSRIATLGLEGPSGEFLMAAVRGEATISAMQVDEVQRFLEDHPSLVDMLRIKLA